MLLFCTQLNRRPVGSWSDVTTVLWLLFTRRFQETEVTILPRLCHFEHFIFQNFLSSLQFLRHTLLVVTCADVSGRLSEFSYGEICKHILQR
jgi:hypothetical protein